MLGMSYSILIANNMHIAFDNYTSMFSTYKYSTVKLFNEQIWHLFYYNRCL